MSKSQQLSAQDMIWIYRRIGECRDRGHDSMAWRQHLLSELMQHIGALVGTSAEYHDCFAEIPRLIGGMDIGWLDEKDREYFRRHIDECGLSKDPHWEAMIALYKEKPPPEPGLLVMDRAQLISDRDWHRSIHFNEFRRPTQSDSSLYFWYPLREAGPDVLMSFGLTRAVEDPAFTEHDRQFCYWLLHEIQPLIGKQLAAPGEPSLSELSPRLRQTMHCLLEGDSEKQAAVRLGVSKATVHEYVTTLYRRFGVNSRGELLAHWLRFDRP